MFFIWSQIARHQAQCNTKYELFGKEDKMEEKLKLFLNDAKLNSFHLIKIQHKYVNFWVFHTIYFHT